ncbi:hypothetical protein ASC90_10235 [Rhizobium sp. Root1220]|nr:hypothetical protein ASC90_10235 [Rhizobium sp. Root1220]
MVSLALGSRYESNDKSRSDIDESANAVVNKALKPIDVYVRSLANLSDQSPKAGTRDETNRCLYRALSSWADAGALSDLGTLNAKLAISPRVAGMAISYRDAKAVTPPDDGQKRAIEAWLQSIGMELMTFFDDDAPKMASQNNLRAWAGLAVGQIGVATDNDRLSSWGAKTNEMVICSADDDGGLPLEMKRGDKALHYQLHAVGPLVVNAALLNAKFNDSFSVCQGKLDRIVDFTLSAIQEPELAAAKAGTDQTFSTGKEKLEAFQIAWLEPYLKFRKSEKATRLAEQYRPLSNSNLGGNLTIQYSGKSK